MADSKQYELIFLLRAQMDASLKQFSLVGGQIKELEQKIQQYNNTLKDIGAYKQQTAAIADYQQKLKQQEEVLAEVTQKFSAATAAVKTAEQAYRQHQTAIDSLNLKISEIKARMAELSAAMKQDGADTKALAQQKAECSAKLAQYNLQLQKEKQALQETKQKLNENRAAERELLNQKNQSQAAMDRLREKLAQEREKLIALSEALKKAGVDTKNLEAAEKSLAKQIKEATDEQERVTEFANRVNDLADKFMVLKMAASGVESAIKPVMNFFKESLDAAAKLEYGMSSVQAVSGATATETEKLTAVVKQMGATTIYTAEESSKAMQNMALAGWDAQQMISGLPAVIKLAAASGEDLAEMTSIVSDGMNAFQLSGEKAAVKFADVLAKAATRSNTNVSLLGQSLSYVETTAGNLGYSIEDVSLALAAMANNALKGGVSGSALNTILTRMSGSNSTASKQMEKMGLSMYYTADAMGHAEGEAKDLKTFLDELREAFQDFGDDAQAAQVAAYNLAGMRGMRGLLAIVNQSDEQWEKLTQEVYNYSGAADQISGVRMDNYTGQMYLLTSAWDALQTSVGEEFIPTATDALGVLTDITNGANDFVQNHGGIVRGIATITATTLGLTAGVIGVATAVQAVRMALTALEVGKLLAVVGGFGGLLAIAAAVGVAVAAFTSNVDNGVQSVKELTEAARDMDKTMEEAAGTYEETSASILATANVADIYIDKLEKIEAAEGENAAQNQEYQNTLGLLLQVMPSLSDCISQTTDEYGRVTYALETTNEALRANTEEWKKNAEAQAYQEYLNSLMENYNDVVLETTKNEIELTKVQDDLRIAQERRTDILARMRELEAGNENYHGGYFDTDVDAIGNMSEEYRNLQRQLAACDNEIAAYNRDIQNHEDAIKKGKETIEEAKKEYERAEKTVRDMIEATEDGARSQDEMQGALEGLFTSLEKIEEQYAEVASEAYESFHSQFSLFDTASMKSEEYLNATVENAQKALDSQLKWWNSYRDNLNELQKLTAEDIGATQENFDALLSYLRSGAPEAAGLAASIVKSVNEGDAEAVGKLAETVGAVDQAQQEASNKVAELMGDIDGGLGAVEERVAEAIENMNLDEEAAESVRATLQAMIDEASYMGPKVQAAYERVRLAAEAGLNGRSVSLRIHTASDSAWAANRTSRIPGYAGGTDYAPRGLALVGERGPELVMMSGGERVIPAEQTARILESGGNFQTVDDSVPVGTLNLNMKFEVSDNATPETVRELRDYSGEIKEMVRSVIREERIDARRRSFT